MNHSELTHKWAHAEPDASRRSGSLSFVGDTLYSYSTPIAKIYRNKRGVLVLFSEHRYSVSTAGHISLGEQAVSHLDSLRVPRYIIGSRGEGRYRYSVNEKQDHATNLAHLASVAADHLKAAQRAQRTFGVEWRQREALDALRGFARYCAFFGIRRKAPAFPTAEWDAAFARVRRIENPDPASKDARERAKARKAQAEYARRRLVEIDWEIGAPDYSGMAERSDWRLFGAFSRGYCDPTGPVMLRVNGEEIETSMGARVPLAAAPMVWSLVERARKQGGFERENWRAGFTDSTGSVRNYVRPVIRIGDYPLDRIDADGTLHAGCHTIPYSELAAMARQLGIAS